MSCASPAAWARGALLALTLAAGALFYPGSSRSVDPPPRPAGPPPEEIRQAYERAGRMNALTTGRVFKTRVAATWFAGNKRFWYRNDLRGGAREFVLVDAEKGERNPAFDHKRLAEALSKAAGAAHAADKLPFDTVEFVEDGKALRFKVRDTVYQCDLTSYECTKVRTDKPEDPSKDKAAPKKEDPLAEEEMTEEGDADEEPQERRRPPGTGQGDRPREWRSPDGRWTATVKDHNVVVRSKETEREIRLTPDGKEGNAYTSVSWAPDSKTMAAVRTEPAEAQKAYALNSVPTDQFRPKLSELSYRLPGDKMDAHELWVLSVEDKKPVKADVEKLDFGTPQVRWKKDARHFSFQRADRGHQRVRLVEVEAATGKARTVLEEKTDTRLVRAKAHVTHLDETNEVLWASERDGWNHLYLLDAATGAVKNPVTKGKWAVRRVERVDEKDRRVWFTANGMDEGTDPYLTHYYRVNLDGTGLVRLTEGDGSHAAAFSPDHKYLIDTYSRVDTPPVTLLRRTSDGGMVCELEKADVSALSETGWRRPEVFVAKGRDGDTDIWGVVYRPSNFDDKRKYPVIENIYAGPWTASVPKTFSTNAARQALAELGFLVVQIDGMGLPGRSKAFHDVSHQNHADAGLPDRIAWIKALAKKYPYVDLDRVGVYGHSGGGYSSLRAMLDHPEFYKVAVSSSGNHDPRGYNLGYSEQWMGHPVGDHYKAQSNATDAHKLRGKLLLMHGEADTNVVMSLSTMKVVDALVKADKDFDLLILPGRGHGVESAYVTRRRYDFFVKHLLGVEPPPPRAAAAGKAKGG